MFQKAYNNTLLVDEMRKLNGDTCYVGIQLRQDKVLLVSELLRVGVTYKPHDR